MHKYNIDNLKKTPVVSILGGLSRLKRLTADEYAAPCPVCGGDDRFHVHTGKNAWFCSKCTGRDRWKSTIDLVMHLRGVDFREACCILTGANVEPVATWAGQQPEQKQRIPSDEWRRAGELVVKTCQEILWSPEGAGARAWLLERGINEETARKFSLGYCDRARQIEGLWVYRGILIPWYFGGELWNIRIRLLRNNDKYRSVTWAKNSPHRGTLQAGVPIIYGADHTTRKPIIFTPEGEFDAMLLQQEAGDLVDVVTFGSCGSRIDPRATWALIAAERIFIAYDVDANQAGQRAAEKLMERYPQMKRAYPPAKDVTDMWRAGWNLREWVESIAVEPEPCEEASPTLTDDPEPDLPTWAPATDPESLEADASILETELLDLGTEQSTCTGGPWGYQPLTLEYDTETADLVEWFQEHRHELPGEPFNLDPVARIINPAGWYAALENDIAAGPAFIRATWGLLKDDLKKLKTFVETNMPSQEIIGIGCQAF